VQAEYLAAADHPRPGFDGQGMYLDRECAESDHCADVGKMVDPPPFEPGNLVRHKTSGIVANVDACERRFDVNRTRFVVDGVTADRVQVRWYADDCERAIDDAVTGEAVREAFEDCDQIERLRRENNELVGENNLLRRVNTRLGLSNDDLRFQAGFSRERADVAVAERDRLAASMRQRIEKIVCTEGVDKGVVLLSNEGPTHYDEEVDGQVYDHEYFSPLGDALIGLWHLVAVEPSVEVGPGDRV